MLAVFVCLDTEKKGLCLPDVRGHNLQDSVLPEKLEEEMVGESRQIGEKRYVKNSCDVIRDI